MNDVANTVKFTQTHCRICQSPCEANKRLGNRGFREKLQDIICRWIPSNPTTDSERYHVCSLCQTIVEEFYTFKTQSRKVLRGEAPVPSTASDNEENGRTLQALLDNCVDEVTLPPETLEDIGIQTEQQLKKIPRTRKMAWVPCTPERVKRSYHRKTDEERAALKTSSEYRRYYNRLYADRYKIVCTICGKSLKRDLMEGHTNRHNDIQPYTCEQCGQQFHCRVNMRIHIRRIHAPSENIVCEPCDKVFRGRIAYKQHVRMVHKERKLECLVCGLKIPNRFTLERHMDIHNQKRDFICSQCGKKFYRPYLLKMHFRIHSGETPYKCHVCQTAYVHRRIYVEHMKKLHPGEALMRIDGTKSMKDTMTKRHF